MTFLMAGGGTGGHVVPSLAVARELRRRGHEPFFIGTRHGFEARFVPAAGFPLEWIDIGGLKNVGLSRRLRSLWQLPASVGTSLRLILRRRPAAVFSMGGYVAAPPMIAALLARVPMVVMEPNAHAGFTSRRLGRFARRALITFPETARYFRAPEVTGLPVRPEFFALPSKPREAIFHVLVTGGSRGARRLNHAVRDALPLLADAPVRFTLQCGADALDEMRAALGGRGDAVVFIDDMPGAFGRADLVVARSGAGSIAELAAAGKPAILVPFPFAADDHQTKNARAMERAGAARLVADAECTGARLAEEIRRALAAPEVVAEMSRRARLLARPGAAERAADLLEELAGLTVPPKAETIVGGNVL